VWLKSTDVWTNASSPPLTKFARKMAISTHTELRLSVRSNSLINVESLTSSLMKRECTPNCGHLMPRRSTSVSFKRLLRKQRPFQRQWQSSTGRRTRVRFNVSANRTMLAKRGICSSKGGSRRTMLRRPCLTKLSTSTGKEIRILSRIMRQRDNLNSRLDLLNVNAIRTCFKLLSNAKLKLPRLRSPNVSAAVKKYANCRNSTRNKRVERMIMTKCTRV